MRTLVGLAIVFVVVLVSGCVGEIVVGPDDPDDDVGEVPIALVFASPASGAQHTRDVIENSLGRRVANVDVVIGLTGTPASVELAADGVALGTIDLATGRGQAMLIELGITSLTAIARNAAGDAVATATVDVDVVDPEIASCRNWLDLYGAVYQVGPAREGVADPVTLTTPINGLKYRAYGAATPRSTFFMDCALARSLLEAAPHLRERGIVEVTDIGVYNYRCIGGGTPPDCPSGLSQHAYAKGIDIAHLTADDGTLYSVEDDWIIDPSTEPTCTAATANDKDAFLHDSICALKRNKIWNIVLTPNYNDAHRNHFHVDLTTGSNFIRKRHDHNDAVDLGPDNH